MSDINSSTWSTLDASNDADSPNGYNAGTTHAQVIAIQQAAMGAIKRVYERSGPVLTSTGASPNYIVTPSNTAYPTALNQGDIYSWIASFTNSGACNLVYNGFTVPIRKVTSSGLSALSGNEIISGQTVIGAYNGAVLQIVSHLPGSTTNGTVTSVGMTGDGVIFNSAVTGSPITSSGTLVPSLKTQSANLLMSGPATGSAAVPAFRSMVAADLPNSGATAGSYTTANITVDAKGRVTAAATGTAALPTAYGVGSSVMAASGIDENINDTIAGTSLTVYAATAAGPWTNIGNPLTGTWRCMMTQQSTAIVLWMRIS